MLSVEHEIQKAAALAARENERPNVVRMRRAVLHQLLRELGPTEDVGASVLYSCVGPLSLEVDEGVTGLFWIGEVRPPHPPKGGPVCRVGRLEREEFRRTYALGPHVASRGVWTSLYKGQKRIELTMEVFGAHAERRIELPTFQVPATWLQAIRERWLPAWWLRRFPVRYRELGGGTIEVKASVLFPELAVPRGVRWWEYYVHEPRLIRSEKG